MIGLIASCAVWIAVAASWLMECLVLLIVSVSAGKAPSETDAGGSQHHTVSQYTREPAKITVRVTTIFLALFLLTRWVSVFLRRSIALFAGLLLFIHFFEA